ncbi:MAG TPA: SBBP repeat-containing protein [Terriglobia bacterium]|nr:SBBP repeat-containing protein [Terriglobia bacterium]
MTCFPGSTPKGKIFLFRSAFVAFSLLAFLTLADQAQDTGWVRQFGPASYHSGMAVAVDTRGSYGAGYVGGNSPGQIHNGGGIGDALTRGHEAARGERWSRQFGTAPADVANGVAADSSGVYVTGYTLGAFPEQAKAGVQNTFVARLQASGPPPPFLSEGGVVNNASYAPHPAPVSPGSIAAVFGTNLNDGSTVPSSFFGPDGKLATTLGGASVTVNGIPAPLFYSTPFQLGIQIPFELGGQSTAQVVVTTGGQSSAPRTVNLDTVAPGIFTTSQQGIGRAVALHQDGVSLISGQNPARLGEVITLFATGLGATSPPLGTGEASAGQPTLSSPTVFIGGLPVLAEFSGTAPGYAGLNQINVRIPANGATGPDVPVVLAVGGKQSNPVVLPIAP